MRVRVALLATVLVLAPLVARAADLVVWWEQGFHPEEGQALRETIAAFEHKTGDEVQLVVESYDDKILGRAAAAVGSEHPPDLVQGDADVSGISFPRWAHEGRLVDLSDALGSLAAEFDKDALADATLLDATTGRRGLFALPVGRITTHLHVWKSLLERAGLGLGDIPQAWEPFWSFWCDKVQPAVRKATGREDVWGVGLPMSVSTVSGDDAEVTFAEFVTAYGADYVTREGRLVIDEPQVRAGLVRALDGYTLL